MSLIGTITQVRERLFSPLGLHVAGFGILAVATIVLGIRVGLDWRATSSSHQDETAARTSPATHATPKQPSAAARTRRGLASPDATSRTGPTRRSSVPRIPSL